MSRFCVFFFPNREEITHFYISTDDDTPVILPLHRWCSMSLPATMCLLIWAFSKACWQQSSFFLSIFNFLTMKYLHHYLWFLSCQWYFFKKKLQARVFLETAYCHSSGALLCEQTPPIFVSPFFFSIASSSLRSPLFPRKRSPQYSRCEETTVPWNSVSTPWDVILGDVR